MRPGYPVHDSGWRHHGAQRQPGCNPFGDCYNIGLRLEVFHRKHFTGAAHSGLNFIGNVKNAVLFSNLTHFLVKSGWRYDIPAFALNGFDKNRGNLFRRHRCPKQGVLHPFHAKQLAFRVAQIVNTTVTVGVGNVRDTGHKGVIVFFLDRFAGGQ